MNNISIQIKSLGPIKDASLTLRPLMIFTGESGLGKSYLAFLSNYIYALLAKGSSRLSHVFDNIDFNSILDGKKSGDVIYTLCTKDLFSWIDTDAVNYIGYMIGNNDISGEIHIEWPQIADVIEFVYTESLSGLDNIEELSYKVATKNFNYNSLSDKKEVNKFMLTSLVKAELFKIVFEQTPLFSIHNFVLPPSRGAIMDISEQPVFRSGMYETFFSLKSDIVRPSKQPKEDDAILIQLLRQINDGAVTLNDNGFTYTTLSGIKLPLSAAASSVREIAPLALMLKKYDIDKISVLFEEPEAHMHPTRQQFVADLIGYLISQGGHLQITTHSDYFIKRINSLIKLHQLIKEMPEGNGDSLLAKHGFIKGSLINADKVVAYNLYRDGDGNSKVSRLDIDTEAGVPFDSFQNVISRYFDLLSDLNLIKDKDSES